MRNVILAIVVSCTVVGCASQPEPAAKCEADITVNGLDWHATTPAASCTVQATATDVYLSLDQAPYTFTMRIPRTPEHFATGDGQGFGWTSEPTHHGVGDWIITGTTWEVTFNADDGYPLGGSVRGAGLN